jgi:hypothetical protein
MKAMGDISAQLWATYTSGMFAAHKSLFRASFQPIGKLHCVAVFAFGQYSSPEARCQFGQYFSPEKRFQFGQYFSPEAPCKFGQYFSPKFDANSTQIMSNWAMLQPCNTMPSRAIFQP